MYIKQKAFIIGLLVFSLISITGISLAVNTQFNQTINPGVLSVAIVDSLYSTVVSPAVTFGVVPFSLACQTSTGTLGTASEQLYVQNPDGADNGWVMSIAGNSVSSVWDGTPSDYDFNDPTSSGCLDGGDSDSFGGQMTINPSGATLAVGQCSSCSTSNISLGSSAAFNQGTLDNITLLNASASSNDIGDWTLRGVSVSQTIPKEQAVASDYDIPMIVSVVAN